MEFNPEKMAAALNEAWENDFRTITDGKTAAQIAVLRSGDSKEVVDLKSIIDNWRDKPQRVVGTSKVQSPVSFAELVLRHKNEASALFCDAGAAPSLTAVIDYHGAKASPEWAKHRIHYAFPLSDEWQFWKGVMAKGRLTQEDFAYLVDERIADMVSATDEEKTAAQEIDLRVATPAEMLTLSRGLLIRVSQVVKEARNTGSGADQIVFDETHEGENGQPVNIPGMFILSIPVFTGANPVRVMVRLRYRIIERKTVWMPQLYRPDILLRKAIENVAEAARDATSLPLFYGSPEA